MSTTYYTHPIGSLNRLSIILVCFYRLLFVFRFGLECRQPPPRSPLLSTPQVKAKNIYLPFGIAKVVIY